MSDLSLSPSPSPSRAPEEPASEDFHDPPTAAAAANPAADLDNDLSDADSILSDVDEAQFEDFDPNQITIEERPTIAVDEDNVKALKAHKRKRPAVGGDADAMDVDGREGAGGGKKKKKEGRREKVKKSKKRVDDSDDGFSGGEEIEGKRKRKTKAFAVGDGDAGGFERERARKHKEKAVRRAVVEEEDETLDPEERRRRALDAKMDLALKNPTKRRTRKGEVDLASSADDEIAALRIRMAEAAEADVQARQSVPPKPAMHKLRLLPEVTALLNRNSREIEAAIVDPENNLLESVRFFLEPLSDGSLPAYNIQRELMASLARLPIDKDSLISSQVGKVILFYTKSKKPELSIKRAAERLLVEWTRPILKRSDDFRKRQLAIADYDPVEAATRAQTRGGEVLTREERERLKREKELELPVKGNRARAVVENKTYSIVPRSGQVTGGMFARPLGASGEDAFRRMKARQAAAAGGGKKKA